MEQAIQTISQELSKSVPNLLGAIAILVGGWLLATIVAWLFKAALSRTELDNRLARSMGVGGNIEKWIATAVFWIIMLFVLVAFLQALQLNAVSEPLNGLLKQVFDYAPRALVAGVLAGAGWLVATLCRMLLVQGLKSFSLDDRLKAPAAEGEPEGDAPVVLSETLGNALYWFILLFFLLAVLEALGLQGPLAPVQALFNDILNTLPNILKAGLIGFVGWFIARIVRTVVTNLLRAVNADQLGERFGLSQATGGLGLSSLAGTVVYVLILIPVVISALTELKIEAISTPAIAMLGQVLDALPKILTAAVLLGIGYFIGKLVSEFVSNLLTGIGFNNVFSWLGLQATQQPTPTSAADLPLPSETTAGDREPVANMLQQKTPSEIVGVIAMIGILLVFLIPATDVLEFEPLSNGVAELLRILTQQVLVGVVVFAVGLYLANLVFNLVASSGGGQARLVGQAARVAIIALVSAMGLQQMGIATNIVNLAFGLLLGAIAVAIAVAFGFGSMEIAGEQVRKWLGDFQSKD